MKSATNAKDATPFIFLSFLLLICSSSYGQEMYEQHWQVTPAQAIHWDLTDKQNLPHNDNIEMAGRQVAGIIHYSIDTAGNLSLKREIIFPQLHPFIKDSDPNWLIYRAYLKNTWGDEVLPKLYLSGKQVTPGKLKNVKIDGLLQFEHHPTASGLAVKRQLFPSMSEPHFFEYWTITNTTDSTLYLQAGNTKMRYEAYSTEGKIDQQVLTSIPKKVALKPGGAFSFAIRVMATQEGGPVFSTTRPIEALIERKNWVNQISQSLVLETPDSVLNTLFRFSKVRASESIYDSKLGLIHSPGGGRYYVGTWANDQAEYVSPFFPYLGYDIGNESAINTYRAFMEVRSSDFENIQYAFEVEGTVPPFMLDRGDAAMIAYGATQFFLAQGDEASSREFWPLISWCLEYCDRQLNADGVVQSESDEMEGRIETGSANLSTSALYYGALINATYLARALDLPTNASKTYERQATELAQAIEQYFGANVEGLDTYKYYKEHQYLRHWICLPLVVGIHQRKEATIAALFDRLWTTNGVHVEKNAENEDIAKIFWDRGTLYALRGTFLAGATDISLQRLQEYSSERLLGRRVPYAVEAFPEGSMAHLSAESGLYCRIFTEGLFGMMPIGFNAFNCTPHLPSDWEEMALRHIKAFGDDFDLIISRTSTGLHAAIYSHAQQKLIGEFNFEEGATFEVQLD